MSANRREWRRFAALCLAAAGLAGCAAIGPETQSAAYSAPVVERRSVWRRALRPDWVARSPRWVQAVWFVGPGH